MEWWWLFYITVNNCQTLGRSINSEGYHVETFNGHLWPNSITISKHLNDTVRKTIENASAEFLYTTKSIVAPVINHGRNYVTFSLKSLKNSDKILYAKLMLPTFWAQLEYPFAYTSLHFGIENDFFVNSTPKTSEDKGIITHGLRNPQHPPSRYSYIRDRATGGISLYAHMKNITFSIIVTARPKQDRIRRNWHLMSNETREISGPLVYVQPALVIVARSCLKSKYVGEHLEPFTESTNTVNIYGTSYTIFNMKNTTKIHVRKPVLILSKPIREPYYTTYTTYLQNLYTTPVYLHNECQTEKRALRLNYTETDDWNKTTYVSRWMCRQMPDGQVHTVNVEEVTYCNADFVERFSNHLWNYRDLFYSEK